MKQVPLINARLKRNLKGSRFKGQGNGRRHGHAGRDRPGEHGRCRPTKKPTEAAKWFAFCAEMRDAAAAVNKAIHAQDQKGDRKGHEGPGRRAATTATRCSIRKRSSGKTANSNNSRKRRQNWPSGRLRRAVAFDHDGIRPPIRPKNRQLGPAAKLQGTAAGSPGWMSDCPRPRGAGARPLPPMHLGDRPRFVTARDQFSGSELSQFLAPWDCCSQERTWLLT